MSTPVNEKDVQQALSEVKATQELERQANIDARAGRSDLAFNEQHAAAVEAQRFEKHGTAVQDAALHKNHDALNATDMAVISGRELPKDGTGTDLQWATYNEMVKESQQKAANANPELSAHDRNEAASGLREVAREHAEQGKQWEQRYQQAGGDDAVMRNASDAIGGPSLAGQFKGEAVKEEQQAAAVNAKAKEYDTVETARGESHSSTRQASTTPHARPHGTQEMVHQANGDQHAKEGNDTLGGLLSALPSGVREQIDAHKDSLQHLQAKGTEVVASVLQSAKNSSSISAEQLAANMTLNDAIRH